MKIVKWIGIILAVVLLLGYFIGMPYLREQTKKHSPEKEVVYEAAGITLKVNYCAPFKKNRIIFGDLVPYGEVWRTGANEPTTFSTTHDITVGGKDLPAGTYSLWTIPGKDVWSLILNQEVPDWGVTLLSGGAKTTRNPEMDVLQVAVPALGLPEPVEQLLIEFQIVRGEVVLVLSWDQTQIMVPVKPAA